MTSLRFDHLHDAPPEAMERLQEFCRRAEARALLGFLGTAAVVLAFAWMLEAVHVRDARAALAQAQVRLDRSDVEARAARGQIERLRRALALDRRLRAIRNTSQIAARGMTLFANRLPAAVWLTSLSGDSDGYDVDGRAVGLRGVTETLRAYSGTRLLDVHAPSEAKMKILDFRLHVPAQ